MSIRHLLLARPSRGGQSLHSGKAWEVQLATRLTTLHFNGEPVHVGATAGGGHGIDIPTTIGGIPIGFEAGTNKFEGGGCTLRLVDRVLVVPESHPLLRTLMGTHQKVVDVGFVSTVTRTAGACVLATNHASNSWVESIASEGAFTLWATTILPDIVTEGIYHTCKSPRARSTAKDGIAYLIDGGYAIHLENAYAERVTSETNPTNWPENGIRILRCADCTIDGTPEILGTRRPLVVMPGTGQIAASVNIKDGYFGTSDRGSLITAEYGGTIVTLRIGAAWMGENSRAGTQGLDIRGHHTDGIQGVVLEGTHFMLSAGNGFRLADNFVRDLQIIGGWADGCTESGYAFLGGDFYVDGARAGGRRFGGNGTGFFVNAGLNNLSLSGVASGNINNNIVPGTAASATVVYNVRVRV